MFYAAMIMSVITTTGASYTSCATIPVHEVQQPQHSDDHQAIINDITSDKVDDTDVLMSSHAIPHQLRSQWMPQLRQDTPIPNLRTSSAEAVNTCHKDWPESVASLKVHLDESSCPTALHANWSFAVLAQDEYGNQRPPCVLSGTVSTSPEPWWLP